MIGGQVFHQGIAELLHCTGLPYLNVDPVMLGGTPKVLARA